MKLIHNTVLLENLWGMFDLTSLEITNGVHWGAIKKAAEELVDLIHDDSPIGDVVKHYDVKDFVPRIKPVDKGRIVLLLEHDPLCSHKE